jgi:hypothetical protein
VFRVSENAADWLHAAAFAIEALKGWCRCGDGSADTDLRGFAADIAACHDALDAAVESVEAATAVKDAVAAAKRAAAKGEIARAAESKAVRRLRDAAQRSYDLPSPRSLTRPLHGAWPKVTGHTAPAPAA